MSLRATTRNPARAIAVLAAFALALSIAPHGALGFERYNDGCQSCHGNFTSGGYTSRATGVAWPSSPHTVHRSSSYMNTDCNLCHLSGDDDNPYIGASNGTGFNPGYGCAGCHGGITQAGSSSGEPLRRAHEYTGGAACYGTCHPPGETPAQESVGPPYYGTVDTNVASPCNSDPSTSEDWNNDGQGLDNDSDLTRDGADPACQAGFVFHDGFVSGDGSGWGATLPSH